MDIQQLALQFYDYSLFIRGYSRETIKRYRQIINFYGRYAGISKIEEVTDKNVRELFMYGRVERKWSTNTYVVFQKSLLVFFRWCVERKYMASNPAEGIELPRNERRLPTKLRKDDALKLLEVVYNYPYDYKFLRYRNHAIFSMFIFAGVRKKELLTMKLTDVDLDNLTIFIRQGKGKKDRIIPMSHTLAQSLRRYLEDRRRLKRACAEFFVSLNHNQGFTDSGMKRLVVQMRLASKVPFTIHKLRHTFAILMLEGGCDIYSLSKMMGHSDIKTTTIYLSASAEHLRTQMLKHPLNSAL